MAKVKNSDSKYTFFVSVSSKYAQFFSYRKKSHVSLDILMHLDYSKAVFAWIYRDNSNLRNYTIENYDYLSKILSKTFRQ